MFSRLFGSKKKESPAPSNSGKATADWSFLGTDMHSHLIPGIDDGAQTVNDSIEMIREFQKMGFKGIVTTPHIKSDIYPNNPVIIQNGLSQLQQALKEQEIDFPVRAAAEYYVDDTFMDMLEAGSLLTVHNRELLIEFSFAFEPVRLFETLFLIQTKGYKPIIAHPERYAFFHNRFSMYEQLKDRGCYLQLNVIALTGYYGKQVKDVAERLLAKKMYDYSGSDMHHLRHAEAMQKLQQSRSFEALTTYPFRNKNISF